MKITSRAVLFCLAASTAIAAFKEQPAVPAAQKPAPGAGKNSLPAPNPLPADAKTLQAFLGGTVWAIEGKPDTSHTFLADGHFKGPKNSPTYTITGRRTLTVHWNDALKIPCLFADDFGVMIELGGRRNIWTRMQ